MRAAAWTGAAMVVGLVATATGCGVDPVAQLPDTDRAVANARAALREDVLTPDTSLPKDVTVVAEDVPKSARVDGVDYDYSGAVRDVVELHGALVRGMHSGGEDTSVLQWTVKGSDARSYVRDQMAESAETGTAPVGSYVFRGFEVGGFTPNLLQVDVCLDQSDVRLRSDEGGTRPRANRPASDLLWVGYTMERRGRDTWLAESIVVDAVGEAPNAACAE